MKELRRSHIGWVEEALARKEQGRENKWTEGIAVGSRDFVDVIKRGLGMRAKGLAGFTVWTTNQSSRRATDWLKGIILGPKTCF